MPRRKHSHSLPAAQQGTFVGRVRECAEFRTSIRLLLGTDTPPTNAPNYAHIFLLHGEGGMGKSTLLNQFVAIAAEQELPVTRTLLVRFDSTNLSAPDVLARVLADQIGKQHPGFDHRYRAFCARRASFASRRDELQQQWERWQSLRNSEGELSDESQALRYTLKQRLHQNQLQKAKFGVHTPSYITTDVEDASDELAMLTPLDELFGYAPGSFDELLRREFGEDDAALFAEDGRALGQALSDDLFDLAEAAPLLLALDTYEHADANDDWLRETILANASDQMIVIIAGRNRLLGYDRTFEDDPTWLHFCNLNEQTLKAHEIRDYLRARLNVADDPPDALVAEVAAISRGIPLAVSALGDQLADGGDLAPYQGVDLAKLNRREVVRTITDRFLLYALDERSHASATRQRNQRDRQRIRALALLPPGREPDELLACALWNVPPEQVREVFADLAAQHSFVFQDGLYTLHDLVHEFARADTLDQRERSADWPILEASLRRALILIDERIVRAEQRTANPDDRYDDAAWRTAILDKLNALLWLGEDNAAKRLLLNRWVEAQYNRPKFAGELSALAAELAPQTAEWKRLVKAIEQENYLQLVYFATWLEKTTHAFFAILKTIQLQRTGDLIGALAECDDALNLRPNHAEMLSRRGYVKRLHGDLVGSLADYNQSLLIHPDNAATLMRRGYVKILMDNLVGALTDYDQALKLRPDNADIFNNRGRVKRQIGDLSGALIDYNRSNELRPDDPNTFNNRGNVKRQMEDLPGALADYNRSLKLHPDEFNTLRNRGILKGQMKDFQGALADLNRANELHPNHPSTLNSRGYFYAKIGAYEEALTDLRTAFVLTPQNYHILGSFAETHIFMGDYDTALEWLAKAIAADPKAREIAATHFDYDPIRADPRFIALVYGAGAESPDAAAQ